MFITKTSLSRRAVLRGMGATLALPFLDAMVPASTALARTAANPALRFGAVFIPMGERPGFWTPKTTGAGFEFSPILEAARVVARFGGGRLQSRPAERWHACSEHRDVADRRGTETHRGRRLPRGNLARSDHRGADRSRHRVSIARDRDRGPGGLHRCVRRGIQLRLHEHDCVERADDPAADADQSASGVRADVRQARFGRRSHCADAWRSEHSGLGAPRCGVSRARSRHS